jgi:hypothetical protein
LRYIANITAGALLVPESRKIAGLMLAGVSAFNSKEDANQCSLNSESSGIFDEWII